MKNSTNRERKNNDGFVNCVSENFRHSSKNKGPSIVQIYLKGCFLFYWILTHPEAPQALFNFSRMPQAEKSCEPLVETIEFIMNVKATLKS